MTRGAAPPSDSFPMTPQYLLTVILGWLVPGVGHWILGYRMRGALLGATLLGTFWLGECVLAGRMAVTLEVHPIFFGLQAGNGLSAFAANMLFGRPAHPDQTEVIQRNLPEHLNLGILFCSVSGLLNMLVVLQLLDPRTWREAAGAGRAAGGRGPS
ncbi:MAG: hypothetical protein JXA90_10200 [Planctomycetes bacterium]|nr:hypothetical protein [Planctomycetota bacterium]